MGEFGSGYLGIQLKGKQPSYILGTAATVQNCSSEWRCQLKRYKRG